jgi:hypothetical protein
MKEEIIEQYPQGTGRALGGIVTLSETDKRDLEWWARHHKGNVAYLALRIKKLIAEPDNEEYRKFFYGHFTAVVDEFLKSIHPIMDPKTKEMVEWEESDLNEQEDE